MPCSTRPASSLSPVCTRTGARPAQPTATPVVPSRNGRPKESVTITPTSATAAKASRSRRADASGSTGNSTATSPAPVLERSTPAAAQTKPWWVSQIRNAPRRRTMRALSRRISSITRGSASSAAISRARSDGSTRGQLDAAALDLRDRLLRHAHDVAVAQAAGAALRGRHEQPGEVVAGPQLRQPSQPRDGEVAHARASAARATAAELSASCMSVGTQATR